MLLTIDAGNTRTKWATFNTHGEMIQQHASLNGETTPASFSSAFSGCEHVVISNVAGEEHASRLKAALRSCNLPMLWIKAATSTCGVFNRYENPEMLGSDRWAAIVAAWHIKHAPCIIVNAGTAVTVDALNALNINQVLHGEFIGGLILPGIRLMQQSLGLATAQLPKMDIHDAVATQKHQEIFARNTADAIYNGSLHGILGAIEHMSVALDQHSKQTPQIVISGGDAKLIAAALTRHVTNQVAIVDNLVLQGLYLIHTNEK